MPRLDCPSVSAENPESPEFKDSSQAFNEGAKAALAAAVQEQGLLEMLRCL